MCEKGRTELYYSQNHSFNISVVISVMVTFFYTFYSYSHAFHTTHSLRMSRYSLYEKKVENRDICTQNRSIGVFCAKSRAKIETLF